MKNGSAIAVLLPLLLCACANMQPSLGDPAAKTVATGSAGGATAQNANSQLERCDKSLGTLAIVEEANQPWLHQLSADYRIQSTVPLLRLIIQQSNCFVIVERGKAFNNMQGERELMQSGELRKNSNLGKGMMVAADYTGDAVDIVLRAGNARPRWPCGRQDWRGGLADRRIDEVE